MSIAALAGCAGEASAEPPSIGPPAQLDVATDCVATTRSRTFDANGQSSSPEAELERAVSEYGLPGGEWGAVSRAEDALVLVHPSTGEPEVVISIGRTPANGLWTALGIRYCE